jgi:hypothetical protein
MKKKKGFTLVELLVVIAILAILAAVSVVGYLGFTEKAKDSNDNTLITQLNQVLQADEVLDGKPKTMSEALNVLEENGFVVENLTPTSSKNEFVYDISQNRFKIFNQKEIEQLNDANYWYIVKDVDSLNAMKAKCSVYLVDSFVVEGDLELTYGFDGLNSGVAKLTLNNSNGKAENLILNTNASQIIVNASEDNVSHFGSADTVLVTAVAPNSYHEYGSLRKLEVNSGHVEFMPNSKVDEIYITSANAKVTVTDQVTDYDNITVVVADGVELPEGSVTLPEGDNQIIQEVLVSTSDELIKELGKKKKAEALPGVSITDHVSAFVKLNNDITLSDSLTLSSASFWKVTKKIDLNGKTLKLGTSGLKINTDLTCIIENGTLDYETKVNQIYINGDIDENSKPHIYMNNVSFANVGSGNNAGGHVIESSSYYDLYLNECTYKSSVELINTKDGKSNVIINGGRYEMTTANYNLFTNKGNLTINDGYFTAVCSSSGTGVIKNEGKLTVNGGEFNNPKGAALSNVGQATLNGGKFLSKSCSKCPIYASGTTGLTHYIYSVYSGGAADSFITINDGVYIEGVHGGLAVTSGGAEINGGSIKTVKCETHAGTSHYALYLAGERGNTAITINGGEFTSLDKVAMFVGNSNDGGLQQDARVFVKGGTFNGGGADKKAVHLDKKNGYLSILGGKFTSDLSDLELGLTPKKQGDYYIVG